MENEKKLYPLTAAQEVIYFNLKFSIKPAVVNVCTMMHFDGEIEPEIMTKAVKLGLERNTASSIRVTQTENKEARQYFSNAPVEGFEIIDYGKKSQKALDKLVRKMSMTPFANKSKDVQLYNVKLIKKPDGHYALYFCVSHLAFDAYSLMYMASDIIAIYTALRDGKDLPKNKYNTLAAYEKEWALQKSEQHDKDFKFWHDEIFPTEPNFTSINGLDAKEWKKKKHNHATTVHMLHPKGKHINKTFPKELVDRINAFAVENKVSPQCIYTMAIRNYLSKQSGRTEDVMILNNVARRSTLLQKNAGATFTLAITMRMNFSNELSFTDALNELQSVQRKYFAHSALSTMDMINSYESQYKKSPFNGYTFMNFTFQPYGVKMDETVPVHFTTHSNGYNAMPLYLTVMALDNSGNLNFNYDYNTSFTTPEKIEAFHAYMLKFFDTAINNPSMTLNQLMDI